MRSMTFLANALAATSLLCFVPLLSAQQEIRVRSISLHPNFPVEIHAHLPDGSATAGRVEIKSFLNHETNLLKFTGNRLVFTLRSSPVSATDVNQVLGQVEIPSGLTSCVLLLLPESVEQGDFQSQVHAIDDSAKEFPAGSFKVANLGNLPLKIELAKEIFEFAPGEIRSITKLPFGENQSVSMEAYLKRNDQWSLISSGSWPNPGTRRVFEIVADNLVTKQFELKGIRDVTVPQNP